MISWGTKVTEAGGKAPTTPLFHILACSFAPARFYTFNLVSISSSDDTLHVSTVTSYHVTIECQVKPSKVRVCFLFTPQHDVFGNAYLSNCPMFYMQLPVSGHTTECIPLHSLVPIYMGDKEWPYTPWSPYIWGTNNVPLHSLFPISYRNQIVYPYTLCLQVLGEWNGKSVLLSSPVHALLCTAVYQLSG